MKIKDKSLLFVLILAFLGLILRIYKLGTQSLWIDEGFSINAALAILDHGYPLLESGFIYSGSILNSYLIALFMKIYPTIISARLVSVIFGTLMVILAYYFGKELGNKKIGIITAVFIAFSVWEIAWSRQARMYMQLQFFYILALLYFYRFVNKTNIKNFLLTSLFTLLAIASNALGLTLGLIYIVYLIFNYKILFTLWKKIKTFQKNKWFYPSLIFLAGGLIYVSYLIVINIIGYNNYNLNYFFVYQYYLTNVHFSFYYLGILGLFIALQKDFKKGFLLGISYLIPFLFISYFIYLKHFRYLFFILPIMFVLTAYLIDYIGSVLKKFNTVISVVLVVALLFSGFVFIPRAEYDLERETPQPNFAKAYTYVRENMAEDDLIIDAYPALGNFYIGKVDYALAFSLTGRTVDIPSIENTTQEIYRNITHIDLETLKSLDDYWIILDKLAMRRIDPQLRNYIQNDLVLYEEGSENKNLWSGVSVYGKFKND